MNDECADLGPLNPEWSTAVEVGLDGTAQVVRVPLATAPRAASGTKQDYGTPWGVIHAVEHYFGRPVTFDLAAHAGNKKAERWYGPGSPEGEDSLVMQWHKLDGLLWLNPPFAKITPWVKKCHSEAFLGAKIACLVPASLGSEWYWDYVHGSGTVQLLTPRIPFDGAVNTKTGKVDSYPKDVMLITYNLHAPGNDRINRLRWR